MVAAAQFWISGLVIMLVGGLGLVIFNTLVRLRNEVGRAWANVDVVLQQRHNEVGNLVAAVRDYMAYEKELLLEITRARTRLADARSVREKAREDARLESGLTRLFATVENYPDLKSNHLVRDLMRRISELEELLADRREMYNHAVTRHNTLIAVVPVNLISGPLGFKDEPLFKAEEDARRRPDVALKP